jgi:uncharacterized protein (DUF2126 family)
MLRALAAMLSRQNVEPRLVDASTAPMQLGLRPVGDREPDLEGWQLMANGYGVPLRREQDEAGTVLLTGLRYRAFLPWTGLHPGLGAQGAIVLVLLPPRGGSGLRVTLHAGQPQGRPYDGLPDSLDQARRRIHERFVVEEIARDPAGDPIPAPAESLTGCCFDLRRT